MSTAHPEIAQTRISTVVEALERLGDEHGYPPTAREIAADLGVSQTRVRQCLDQLEREGRIRRQPKKARSIVLTAA